MVQKDQNRNEWKMPLELFGYFVRETTIVDSSREDHEKRSSAMILSKMELLISKILGKVFLNSGKLFSIMGDDPIIMLLIFLIFVFVSSVVR